MPIILLNKIQKLHISISMNGMRVKWPIIRWSSKAGKDFDLIFIILLTSDKLKTIHRRSLAILIDWFGNTLTMSYFKNQVSLLEAALGYLDTISKWNNKRKEEKKVTVTCGLNWMPVAEQVLSIFFIVYCSLTVFRCLCISLSLCFCFYLTRQSIKRVIAD